MLSGRQALSTVDQTINEQHGRIEKVERQIEAIGTKLVEQQRANAGDFRVLARLRVGLLDRGELEQHIDHAEHQVLALLKNRDAALPELAKRIQAAEVARKSLESERSTQAELVDHSAEALDKAEAATQARLVADPSYQAQRARAREAERTAMHAHEKAVRSEEEKDQKGESYRNDPLFMYLWERDFGVPGYKASPLIRWLDGKVAHLVGFADARASYARLNEIPTRLKEHAEGLKAAADAEYQVLKRLDTEAREADGVPSLEKALGAEQAKLDAIDERIAAADEEHQDLLARRAAFASGEDEYTRQAVEYLATELQRDDLMELRREALATPFPDDDLIVSRMLEREGEQRTLEASLRGLKETLQQHQQRLREIETLRVDFKRARYDRSGSSFGDSALVALMLGNFVEGMLDRRTLWRVLQEQQRYQPPYDPWFGSGGFGRGTVWGGGRGGFGGGGFGGGFGGGGGGGFRTGGGF